MRVSVVSLHRPRITPDLMHIHEFRKAQHHDRFALLIGFYCSVQPFA
jgi:hypothetical protein